MPSSDKVTKESQSAGAAEPRLGKRAENRRMRTEALQRSALGLFLQIVDGARTAKGSF